MKRVAGIVLSVALLSVTPALAAHWNVDAAKSKLGFSVPWGKQPFTGTFQTWKANIDFDPSNLAASKVDVTIAVDSETSGDSDSDASIKGDIGFGTGKFPNAHFVTTSFTHKAGNNYVAQGTLTLKGVTKPVTLPFTLTIAGKTAHMVGAADVMRNQFNVGTGEWAKPDPVAWDVKVNIDLMATQN